MMVGDNFLGRRSLFALQKWSYFTLQLTIGGYIHPSWNGMPACSLGHNTTSGVKIFRKDVIGPIDTLWRATNARGRYSGRSDQAWPDFTENETLFVYAWRDTLGKRYDVLYRFVPSSTTPENNCQLGFALDDPDKPGKAFMPCVWRVEDTLTSVTAPLEALFRLKKNPIWTEAMIDTGPPLYKYWDLRANTEKQDSIPCHGDSAEFWLRKVVANGFDTTLYQTLIPFTIDTTWLASMIVADTAWFPEEEIYIDHTPPWISKVTALPDTNFTGPYQLSYDRGDTSGIVADSLFYKLNDGPEKAVAADSVVDNTAYVTIDTIAAIDDSVHYKMKTVDGSNNANVAYWPSEGWHSFKVKGIPVHEEANAKDISKIRVSQNPFVNGTIVYSNSKGKFIVKIYDLAGREVQTIEAENKADIGRQLKAGAYFIKIKDRFQKLIKLR